MLGSSFYDVYHIIFVWCYREKQRYTQFLYWSNFIKYMSTLVINKKYWVTHAVCTTYANTIGDAILHFFVGHITMNDICTPFVACYTPKPPKFLTFLCQMDCQHKGYNGGRSYCSDIYCCCAIFWQCQGSDWYYVLSRIKSLCCKIGWISIN
jgi:hypothetical protein